jgi:hypothetical protein
MVDIINASNMAALNYLENDQEEARMNKVPDRAKMRREYLWKKASAKTHKVFAVTATIVCALVLLIFIYVGIVSANIMCLVFVLGFGIALMMGIAGIREAIHEDLSIPYVAPVEEQIAALPGEEVLLRSSQAAPASPEELLRPASSQETPSEELLRASNQEGAK